MKFFKNLTFAILFLLPLISHAEEIKINDKTTELNFYTGMFDFSDNGKRSTLIGIQHQNKQLNRDTFLGNLSPITGAMITGDNAAYFYTGVSRIYYWNAEFNTKFCTWLLRSR